MVVGRGMAAGKGGGSMTHAELTLLLFFKLFGKA